MHVSDLTRCWCVKRLSPGGAKRRVDSRCCTKQARRPRRSCSKDFYYILDLGGTFKGRAKESPCWRTFETEERLLTR